MMERLCFLTWSFLVIFVTGCTVAVPLDFTVAFILYMQLGLLWELGKRFLNFQEASLILEDESDDGDEEQD